MNVLFLCTGNSCRSIIGEAVFNHLAPTGWSAISAGSHPTGKVNPRALELLAREGICTEHSHSKSWEHLPVIPDIVITVCGNADRNECPAYLSTALRTHWGIEDPSQVEGTDAEITAAFEYAFRVLRTRLELFFAQPLNVLKDDHEQLMAELNGLGLVLP